MEKVLPGAADRREQLAEHLPRKAQAEGIAARALLARGYSASPARRARLAESLANVRGVSRLATAW
jgi:hypothetical protein